MYSALVAPPTPVGRSRLVISTQMRWPLPEQVGGRQHFDGVFVDLPGHHRLRASRVSGCHGRRLRARRIDRAMRGLEPAAGSSRSSRSFGISRSPSRAVAPTRRAHILQDDDPVGVALVDRRVEVNTLGPATRRPRQRLAHIAQPLHQLVCVGGICTNASGGCVWSALDGTTVSGVSRSQPFEIELDPLRLGQRPVACGAPFVRAHHPEAHRRVVDDAGVDAP